MFEIITLKLENLFIRMTTWKLFLRKEKEYGKNRMRIKQLIQLTRGFYSDRPLPYDFKNNRYSDYISDIETIKLAYLNYPYGRLLRNKLVFSNYFNSYFNTPECYCLITKGNIQPVNINLRIASFQELTALIEQKKLIFKPLLGTGGSGILMVEANNNAGLFVNKKPITPDGLKKLITTLNQYLVSDFIQQGEFAAKFFPDTANTIRITTICDPDLASSFIPYSFMRFGRQKTIPADNIALGGLFSMIDLDTGKLSAAFEINKNKKIKLHDAHPDTGVTIKGVIIPGWDSLRNFFIGIGSVIKPFIKIAGWDIILTNDSFYVIEGNNGPDLYMQGASYPFAKIPEVKKFLEYYHIR